MTNIHIKAALNLINDCSIETTPNVYAKYGTFSDLIDKKNSIYVTYLPDEDMNKVIDTSKKLTLEGYSVIPHLPARTIPNNKELEKYIRKKYNDGKLIEGQSLEVSVVLSSENDGLSHVIKDVIKIK